MGRLKAPVLGGRERVRTVVAQVSPVSLDPDTSAVRAASAIVEAAGEGADPVVLPEAWLAGRNSPVEEWLAGRVRWADAAVLVGGAATERVAAAARTYGLHVVLRLNELDPRPGCLAVYNTLLLLDREGWELGRHRKLIPTLVELVFCGSGDGRDLFAVDTDIGPIGGLIRGENAMPLAHAAVIAQGEDIHVTVFPGAFACACGYLDPDDVPTDFPFCGRMNTSYALAGSAVHATLGVRLAGPVFGPQLVYADVEETVVAQAAETLLVGT